MASALDGRRSPPRTSVPGAMRPLRLRPMAPHRRGDRGPSEGDGRCRGQPRRACRQSDRPAVERPPGAAEGQGTRPAGRTCRQARIRKARRAGSGDRRGEGRDGDPHRPVLHRLGLQHPWCRRRPYAADARLRDPACEGPPDALRRSRQARRRHPYASGSAGRSRRAGSLRVRGEGRSQEPAHRPRRTARRTAARTADRGRRHAGGDARSRAAAPRHQERRRNRRLKGRPPARRRGHRDLPRLARRAGTRHHHRDRRGRKSWRRSAPNSANATARLCATSPSTPLPAPARTAPSFTTASTARAIARSARANSSCSIPVRNTQTARPTSPARYRSERRPPRCAATSRWC